MTGIFRQVSADPLMPPVLILELLRAALVFYAPLAKSPVPRYDPPRTTRLKYPWWPWCSGNTAGCGPVITGSIPVGHPMNIRPRNGSDFHCAACFYESFIDLEKLAILTYMMIKNIVKNLSIFFGLLIVGIILLIGFFGVGLRVLFGKDAVHNNLDRPVSVMLLKTDPFHDNSSRDPLDISQETVLDPDTKFLFGGGLECISVDGTAYALPTRTETEPFRLFGPKTTFEVSFILTQKTCDYPVDLIPGSHWTCQISKQISCTRDDE